MSDPNASVSAAAPETVQSETYQGSDLPPEASTEKPRSLWSDAWRELRSSKIFILSAILIFFSAGITGGLDTEIDSLPPEPIIH